MGDPRARATLRRGWYYGPETFRGSGCWKRNDEGMALRPDAGIENARAMLVDRDGLLVFTGTEPFDAVEVIMATRADRDDELSTLRAP